MDINSIRNLEENSNEIEIIKLIETSISFISKPNEVKACRVNLNDSKENLLKLGLVEEDGNWYVKNRRNFPNPVTENSILIKYSEDDIGHCDIKDFLNKYVNCEEFKKGEIVEIDENEIEINSFNKEYTKYKNINISLANKSTELTSNEGVFYSENGVIAIEENENQEYRFYELDIDSFLENYMPDPMNPISTVAYLIFKELSYYNHEERSLLFEVYVSKFRNIDRQLESYQKYYSEFETGLDLREKYRHAISIVRRLQKLYEPLLKNKNYEEKLKAANSLLMKIAADSDLDEFEKQLRVKYILLFLLPKTNNHQHLKGAVPYETIIKLAKEKGLDLQKINEAFQTAEKGFETLSEFSNTYGTIAQSIRYLEDYKIAIESIVDEAIKYEQLTVEIRCSILGLKDKYGNEISGNTAGEFIINTIEEIKQKKQDCPAIGFTILGYRGRDWKPEEVDEQSRLTIEFAKKYPNRKFSFDLAGPEDTGYPAIYFKEAFDEIYKYNKQTDGETIGITVHAGETPTYDLGKEGHYSVREALQINSDRIGHAIRAIDDLETLNMLKADGATVEICGVCNIMSIPINTENLTHHPIDELLKRDIPITICTDNDSICGTNIINEYALLLISGHNEIANWERVIKIARHGIQSSFISNEDKIKALAIFDERIKDINHLLKTYPTIIDKTIEDLIEEIEIIFNEENN